MNKLFIKTTIALEEQDVHIYPTDEFDGIVVEVCEVDEQGPGRRLYLTPNELPMFIQKMNEMMRYATEKQTD